MKNEKRLNNKGFSLVELIIVIAIMAILAGALAPQFIKYIDKSRKAADIQTAQTIASAVNVALANQNAYDDARETTLAAIYSETTETTPTNFQKEIKEILGSESPKPKYKSGTYKDFYISVNTTDKSFAIYAIGSTVPESLMADDMLYPNVGRNFE